MLRIVRYLSKAEIVQMLIALVSIVGQIWFDLTLPDYMADITQLVETPGSEMSDIWIAGGKMLLVSLGSVACAVVTGFIAARVGASFSQRLRSLEFKKVESFGPAEMNRFLHRIAHHPLHERHHADSDVRDHGPDDADQSTDHGRVGRVQNREQRP